MNANIRLFAGSMVRFGNVVPVGSGLRNGVLVGMWSETPKIEG
jgi:hypothetical protein